MNYKQTAKSGIGYGEVHSTNEWYHIIRDKQTGANKQWKNVVKIFKAAVASGQLAKTKEKSVGAPAKAKTAKAATAAVANAVQNAKQKAPKAILKKVSYQVSDPNDTRHWEYKRLFSILKVHETLKLKRSRLITIRCMSARAGVSASIQLHTGR